MINKGKIKLSFYICILTIFITVFKVFFCFVCGTFATKMCSVPSSLKLSEQELKTIFSRYTERKTDSEKLVIDKVSRT